MICIELKPDLTYEIDRRHKIVDFFIEDDYGVKHRCGQSFKLTEELIKKLLKKLNDDCVIVSRKELLEIYEDDRTYISKKDLINKLLEIKRK